MGKNRMKRSRGWIVILILVVAAGALYSWFGLTFVRADGDIDYAIGGCDFDYYVHNDLGGGYSIRTEYYDFRDYDGTPQSVLYTTKRSYISSDETSDSVNLLVDSVYTADGFEGITGKSAAELKKLTETDPEYELSDEDRKCINENSNYHVLNIRVNDTDYACVYSNFGACSVSRSETKLPLCADTSKGIVLALISLGEYDTEQLSVAWLNKLERKGDNAAIAEYLSANQTVIVVRLDPDDDTKKITKVGEALKAKADSFSKWKNSGSRLYAGTVGEMYLTAREEGRITENGNPKTDNSSTSDSSMVMNSDMAGMLSAYAMTMSDAQTVEKIDLPENSTELSIPLAKEALTLCTGHSKSGQAEVMLKSGFEILLQKGYDKKDTDTSHTCAYTVGKKLIDFYGQARTLIVVAVRGTNAGEWVSNFNFAQDSVNEATYAENFLEAGENVYVNLIPILTDYPDAIVLVCGHSRGAAVANILGMTLDDLYGGENVYVYTFATPTTFRGEDGITGYENIFNFINPADVVPHLPLEGWGFGHVGIDLVLPNEQESIDRINGAMIDFIGTAPSIDSYYNDRHSLTGSDKDVDVSVAKDCYTTYQIMLAMASSMTGVSFEGNGNLNMADMYEIMDASEHGSESIYAGLFSRLEKVIGRDGSWGVDIFGQHMPMTYTALIDAYGSILEQFPSMITPKMLSGRNLMDLNEEEIKKMLMPPEMTNDLLSSLYLGDTDMTGMDFAGMDMSGMDLTDSFLSGMTPTSEE